MAIMMNNSRRKRGRRYISEINVTPMVDVMLVLLIIFMVAAPMIQNAISLDLPEVDKPKVAAEPIADAQNNIVVTIDKNGGLYIDDQSYDSKEEFIRIVGEIKAMTGSDNVVMIRADESVSYGKVMSVMALIKQAGFVRVGLATEG